MVSTQLAVGLGEIKTAKRTGTITAYGLGSCVGVVVYDREAKVGGMAHIMLPEEVGRAASELPGRYAGSGVERLLQAMAKAGADVHRLEVVIGGGAQMLTAPGLSDRFNIGARNIEKVAEALKRYGLRIRGESVGGHSGRTVSLDVATGEVTVKKVGDKEPTVL